jgi:hypothetical protein
MPDDTIRASVGMHENGTKNCYNQTARPFHRMAADHWLPDRKRLLFAGIDSKAANQAFDWYIVARSCCD